MTETDAPSGAANETGNGELDLGFVDEAVARHGRGREAVIPLLQALQTHYRYLPKEALELVCAKTEITPAQLAGVSTFYTQFRHRPAGRHMIKVCVGTACHVAGAQRVHEAYCQHLEIPEGEDTDEDRLFTVDKVPCLGCCTLAPAVQIGDVTYGYVSPETAAKTVADFLELEARRGSAQARPPGPDKTLDGWAEIRISLDSSDIARGSAKVFEALEQAVYETGAKARVKTVGATGLSYLTPIVEVLKPGEPAALYGGLRPEDARDIVLRHFRPASFLRRMKAACSRCLDVLMTDQAWEPVSRHVFDVRDPHVEPYAAPQVHIATEYPGELDPTDLDEYRAAGGFTALERCLKELDPQDVIDEITHSGLRGRGGAGYPTGLKWSQVLAVPGRKKYVVCNGDEGDPGAFMDRMLLECYPYRVIEGMAVAASTIGADEGYCYIRAEYPLAIKRMNEAMAKCEASGLLGEGVLGTNFSFRLHIMEGAGAFVCGEETALLASIMGGRGMPRLRPPYPAQEGLWGKPTLVNNTETYACVSWVLRSGAEAFRSMGTAESKGTKVFALAGKIRRGGLIEVPMGVTIREIVDEIGGGIIDDKAFKAVQIGGPSGGCVPARLADTTIDYEALHGVGAMMGSGGLVVLDETDCMVDIARYFLQFTQHESCGKCTFCRVGTRRMLEIMDRLVEGEGKAADLDELADLGRMIKRGSLCGLGKTAPNPVLSTLEYFREEYEAHVAGHCPAGVCKALITYSITDECIGCTRCAQGCPADAIEMRPYLKHEIDTEKCIRCGACMNVCPVDAVKVE